MKEHTFVPPRSKEFYRVGPEFKRTCQNFQLTDPTGKPLYTIISARIDRGFQKTDNDTWLSYRRNYFTLAASFSIVEKDNVELGKVPTFPVHVSHGDVTSRVQSFAIRLTAFRICSNGDAEEIALIQHTPKRDKGPRQPPAIVPAIPGLLPDHDFMRDNANYRSSAQLRKVEPFFYRSKSLLGPFTENYPTEKVAHVVLFDRVQFTTAGGGGSQVCKAAVQLIVTLEDDVSYVVAWCETPPFTLRNRSPGNYYDDGTLIPRSRKGFTDSSTVQKRTNSFVAERPDLKIPKVKHGMFAFDSKSDIVKSERFGDKKVGEYKEVKFESSTNFKPEAEPESTPESKENSKGAGNGDSKGNSNGANSEHTKVATGDNPPLEKRKRGRPRVIREPPTKSSPAVPIEVKAENKTTAPVEKVEVRQGRTRRKVESESVKVKPRTRRQRKMDPPDDSIQAGPSNEKPIPVTNLRSQAPPAPLELESLPVENPEPQTTSNIQDPGSDSDSDSDDYDESEEEMRKRDLMRLRSGSMHLSGLVGPGSNITNMTNSINSTNSSTINNSAISSGSSRPFYFGALSASSTTATSPFIAATTAASTVASPALSSFEFLSQSSIGRARPSASRETHTPATGGGSARLYRG